MSVLLSATVASIAACGVEGEHSRKAVVAYWMGDPRDLPRYRLDQLTHLCYSFLHLQGNRLVFSHRDDRANVADIVALKKSHPGLSIILSVGGWGGCPTCSGVFATEAGRQEFAQSARALLDSVHADGLDLDWEYPAIEGFPGHRWTQDDRRHFTLLVAELRRQFGTRLQISFAAGGFREYLERSIDWDEVMPLVDRVHLMSYDLVNGNSTVTGHHTPLYSTPEQPASTDLAVRYLDSAGVPPGKIVIGVAFYARVWEGVKESRHGLYQQGKFSQYLPYLFLQELPREYECYWDSVAQAPYRYNAAEGKFATYDDERSIALKARYVLDKHLGGIMFWELHGDVYENGLLNVIDSVLTGGGNARDAVRPMD